MGKWKLILYQTNTDLNPKMELFDLEADIAESKDLSAQFPEKISALLKIMDKAHSPAENKTFKFASERSSEELERIKKPKKKKKSKKH